MRRFLRSFRGLIASLPARRPARGATGSVSAACALIMGLVLAFGSRASAQVFADNFADGIVSAYWQPVSASPSVTMVERNSHAELTTIANPGLTTAHYAGFLAKGWSIRCTSNWAARAVLHSQPRTNGALGSTEYVSFGTFRPGSPLSATGFPTQSKLFNVGTIYIEPQFGGFNRRVEYVAYDQFGGASYIATPWAANASYPFEFYTATSSPVYAFDFTYTETLYLQYVAASDTLYVSNYSYNDPDGFFFVNWTGGQRYPVALAIGGFANRPATTTGANTWIDSVSVDVGVIDTAPGSVAASDGTFGNKVRVTWTAAANATGYKVLRQSAGGSVEQIAQLGQAALAYDDTTAAPLVEYTYFVRTINALGDGFEFSDTGWRNVAVPSGVAASDGTFTDKVRVTWTASTGAVGYSVWRAIGTGTPVLLGQTSGETETTYDDTTAAIATTYTYTVKAVSVLGSTGFSTSDTGVRAPAPPADVAASDGTYAAKVRVSWTALNGATGYRIYRRIEGGVAAQIAVVTGGTTTFYDDTTATPLTTYLYSVKTTTTSVDSATSDENSGWRNLAAPALAASQGTSESGVVLTWSAIAGATGYELFRTAPGGSAQPLASLEAVTGFTDTTADPLVIYTYTAKSVHPLGLSPSSAAVTGWRNVPGPSAVMASDGTFASKVQVEWTSVSGATGYTVWRKLPSAAAYAQIGTVAGGATLAYADTTAAVATTYQYAVKATNSAGSTAFSPSDTGWRNTTAPGSVAASDGTYNDKVRVTWTAAPSATGYKVFRTEPGGSAVEIGSVAATALLFDDTTAAIAVFYAYSVQSVCALGAGGTSAADNGVRAPGAPTNVAASDGTFTDKVRVTWTAVNG
ncbi:MAG: hypothetical protein LW806_09880, partial [Planctomycetaceae bacterium]|nr:hypothetical protein [Planctomycetaceae bacterium]